MSLLKECQPFGKTKFKPVMRYHGGKFRLAPWLIQFFPEHRTYVEPFGGAASVFLHKKRSKSEVYNDLDNNIVNVFRVLQNKETASRLKKLLFLTPYSRAEFSLAFTDCSDNVESARRTIIRAFMGFGSAGASKGTTGFRIDSGRHYGTASYLWNNYPKEIPVFCERFKGVLIESKPALEVIANHDREDTIFYFDPPYLPETRSTDGQRYYRHEMSDNDHIELLDKITLISGMAIISGYENDMYNDILHGWVKKQIKSRISSGRGTAIRIETVWLSPAVSDLQRQKTIFQL